MYSVRHFGVCWLGIIRYMLHPYCFSSNGISVKSSRDVTCTLLSLAYYPCLYTFLYCHPYFYHQFYSIVFYACIDPFLPPYRGGKYMHCLWATPTLQSILFTNMFHFQQIIFRMMYQCGLIKCRNNNNQAHLH